mmetsp:Transcript_24155/g.51518  ORF Transcript_24155/g.51518 Transcript_24155/m.51518 type:complete len:116 (-) Transcript_24155:115-462(-)
MSDCLEADDARGGVTDTASQNLNTNAASNRCRHAASEPLKGPAMRCQDKAHKGRGLPRPVTAALTGSGGPTTICILCEKTYVAYGFPESGTTLRWAQSELFLRVRIGPAARRPAW